MPVFDSRSFKAHEQVMFCNDAATGLKAIIAVHSTALGPAAGGTRFWDYKAAHKGAPADVAETRAEQDAVYDVLRLSRSMSYKNAMAGLRLGGGKSVIMGNPRKIATPELMRAFGRFLDRMGGCYYAAADVGTRPDMLKNASEVTSYVAGLDDGEFATGEPAPHTALGVFTGMQAALRHKFGKSDLNGLKVAVQGVGHVGLDLTRHLRAAGAEIYIADIVDSHIQAVLKDGPATVVTPDAIHACDVDIFAPCALGGIINAKSIPEITATIIAGAANNQLETESVGDTELMKRGILYAPDYVINAGGIISVEFEVHREKIEGNVRKNKVLRIGETLSNVFAESDKQGLATGIIANKIAEDIIQSASAKKLNADPE